MNLMKVLLFFVLFFGLLLLYSLNTSNLYILYILFGVALFGLLLVDSALVAKNATAYQEAVQQFAVAQGFEFKAGTTNIAPYKQFQFARLGRNHKILNHMQGDVDNADMRVFDYYFKTGSGKSKRDNYQTVIAFVAPHLNLVKFTIRPKSMFRTYKQHIVTIDDELFNKRYTVLSHFDGAGDDKAIRQQLNAALRDHLRAMNGRFIVEGTKNRLVIWQDYKRLHLKEIKPAIEDAKTLLKHLGS